MSTQQYFQLIAVAIIFGISFLGWLYRKLKEQAAIKRIEDQRRRREEEILRTGRDPHAAPPGPEVLEERRRQQEVASRRESELQELRRRQGARMGGPIAPGPGSAAPTSGGGILIQIPGTAGPIVVKPVPRATRPPSAPPRTPQRQATPQPRPPRPARTRAGPAGKPPKRPAPRPLEPTTPPLESPQEARPLTGASPETPGSGATEARPGLLGQPMSPEDWRRALVTREILSAPLALRSPDSRGRGDPF